MTAVQIKAMGRPCWSFRNVYGTALFSWDSCCYWVLVNGKIFHFTAAEFADRGVIL